MSECQGGMELYARIPDTAPELQWLVLGLLLGAPAGGILMLAAFLIWGRWWAHLFGRLFSS